MLGVRFGIVVTRGLQMSNVGVKCRMVYRA